MQLYSWRQNQATLRNCHFLDNEKQKHDNVTFPEDLSCKWFSNYIFLQVPAKNAEKKYPKINWINSIWFKKRILKFIISLIELITFDPIVKL